MGGRKVSGRRDTFVRVLRCGASEGEVRVNGRFVYAKKHKSAQEGRAKTEEYIDSERRLVARFCLTGPQESVRNNASAPTSQFRSFGVLLSIIAHIKWNLRAMDGPMEVLKSKHLWRNIYLAPSIFTKTNHETTRGLIKPLYGLSADCKGWYITLRGFRVEGLWAEAASLDKSVYRCAEAGLQFNFGTVTRKLRAA